LDEIADPFSDFDTFDDFWDWVGQCPSIDVGANSRAVHDCVPNAMDYMINHLTNINPNNSLLRTQLAWALGNPNLNWNQAGVAMPIINGIIDSSDYIGAITAVFNQYGLNATIIIYSNSASLVLNISSTPALVCVQTPGGTYHQVTMRLIPGTLDYEIVNLTGGNEIRIYSISQMITGGISVTNTLINNGTYTIVNAIPAISVTLK
jgi:hypothetical protein